MAQPPPISLVEEMSKRFRPSPVNAYAVIAGRPPDVRMFVAHARTPLEVVTMHPDTLRFEYLGPGEWCVSPDEVKDVKRESVAPIVQAS